LIRQRSPLRGAVDMIGTRAMMKDFAHRIGAAFWRIIGPASA
jgi:hypothetical protein